MTFENKLEQPYSQGQQGEIIPQFQITEEVLSKASHYVMQSKQAFEAQRINWRSKLYKLDRAYRCQLEPEEGSEGQVGRAYVGINDKASPLIHDNVEAIIARQKEAIIPTDKDWVDIEVDQQHDSEIVDFREHELNQQFDKLDPRIKLDTALRIADKFGTCIIKVPLVNTQKIVLTRQIVIDQVNTPIVDDSNNPILDANGQPQVYTETKRSVQIIPEISHKYFGPGYQVIDNLEDIYVDPLIEDIQNQPMVIHRFMATWEQMMELADQPNSGWMKDQLMKIKSKVWMGASGLNLGMNDYTARKELIGHWGMSLRADGRPNLYEVFQAHCDFSIPVTNQGETQEIVYPCVISVIGNITVQISPNPYFDQLKPYLKATYRRIEGEFYGESAIDPVLDLYHEYNDTMNQINDSKVLALNPIIIQRAGSLADNQDLDIEPGTRWIEKQAGDIRAFSFDFGPIANGMQYLTDLERRINQGMGITPLLQGSGDSGDLDKTFRGTAKIIAQADKKFKSISIDMEDVLIRQWAEMAYSRNLQFNPIVGQDGTFQQINAKPNFVVHGVQSFFDKQEKLMNIQMIAPWAAQLPGFNHLGLLMEAVDLLGIKIDEQKYGPIYTPPPPPLPESKPLNVSVNIPLDPSKGTWMALAAADLLNKKEGIQIDLDSIGQVSQIISHNTDDKTKMESGMMPPAMDSYSKNDVRNAKTNNNSSKK